MSLLLQFFIGWFYGHVFEYIAHKHILHNRKYFLNVFKHHFGYHHRVSRKNNMYDDSYLKYFDPNNTFEPKALSFLLVLHLPIVFLYPGFYMALVWSVCSYYFVHRKSHTDVEWGKKWLPWHYAHHMDKDQHKNWGVRLPIIDKIVNLTFKNK